MTLKQTLEAITAKNRQALTTARSVKYQINEMDDHDILAFVESLINITQHNNEVLTMLIEDSNIVPK